MLIITSIGVFKGLNKIEDISLSLKNLTSIEARQIYITNETGDVFGIIEGSGQSLIIKINNKTVQEITEN